MFARRLLVMGLMCGSLLLGTAHVAHAKACQCGQDYSVTTPHDTPFNLDVDVVLGDFSLDHIEIGDSPQHGTATVIAPADSDGRLHYVPAPGFVGQDALTVVPVDGNGDTGGAGRVHITVTGPA